MTKSGMRMIRTTVILLASVIFFLQALRELSELRQGGRMRAYPHANPFAGRFLRQDIHVFVEPGQLGALAKRNEKFLFDPLASKHRLDAREKLGNAFARRS